MRLDSYLVAEGMVPSRHQAQGYIRDGRVTVNGVVVTKVSTNIGPSTEVVLSVEYQWVSRGAYKLLHGLEYWGLDPQGCLCLDIGSSTGGFTEVLLHHGAAKVIAVDVGREQMHEPLRSDSRVELHEETHVQSVSTFVEPQSMDVVVCDVSFISLAKVIPFLSPVMKPNGDGIFLVKPQFEVGRAGLTKSGLVKNEALKMDVLERVQRCCVEEGWEVLGSVESPILGGDGNGEYLLHVRKLSS